jgi:hypothetical protein
MTSLILTIRWLSGSFIASNPLADDAFRSLRFWLCSLGWAIGFVGNGESKQIINFAASPRLTNHRTLHQSTTTRSFWLKLFGMSRYSQVRKGKGKATAEQIDQDAGTDRDTQRRSGGQEDGTYKVPRGGLFYWIAFPNYTCEW